MKQSFKTLSIVAAAGVSIYTIFMVGIRIAHTFWPRPYHFDLLQDIFFRGMCDILLISIAISAIALKSCRPLQTATKQFRVFTYIFAALLVLTFICSPFTFSTVICICGAIHFWPPFGWRMLLLILGIVWLLMISKQPETEPTPRAYRVALICGIVVLAFPILCEIASGISLLCNGHILHLNSSATWTWIRYIVPTILLCWYSIELRLISKKK